MVYFSIFITFETLHCVWQNVTRCKVKSPAFLSRPHFLMADPHYLRQFQAGLEPDAARHDSHLLIEPLSSIPIKVNTYALINPLTRGRGLVCPSKV